MMGTPADPAVFLTRLGASRTALLRGVLFARVAVLAMLPTLPAQRSMLDRHSALVAAVWTVLAVYLVAAALASRPLAGLIERHPWLLWADQFVCAGLVVIGAGGRLAFYYLAAAPVVVAVVLVSVRMALALAALQSAVVASVLTFGVEPALEPAHATEWVPGLVGLFVAAGLFATVRRLFDGLEEAGVAYRESAHATAAAARLEAASEQRIRVAAGLNARLSALLRELCAEATRLRLCRSDDAEWGAQAEEVERIARDAEIQLRQAVVEDAPAATVGGALTVARERVRRLGADRVGMDMDGAVDLRLEPAAAAALTRFAQEALSNAWKHGQPPIEVRVRRDGRRVTVTVADAGAGFDPEATERRRGLRSLSHDARSLHGELRVSRRAGGGSQVEVDFEAGDG